MCLHVSSASNQKSSGFLNSVSPLVRFSDLKSSDKDFIYAAIAVDTSRSNSVYQNQSMNNECFPHELCFILPLSCRRLLCPLLHLPPPALPRHVELSTQKIQPWKAREDCDWFSPESLLLPPLFLRTPSLSLHKLARNLINIVKFVPTCWGAQYIFRELLDQIKSWPLSCTSPPPLLFNLARTGALYDVMHQYGPG